MNSQIARFSHIFTQESFHSCLFVVRFKLFYQVKNKILWKFDGGFSEYDSRESNFCWLVNFKGETRFIFLLRLSKGINLSANPLTPMSDKHVTSLYNIHTLFSKQVMRILKLITITLIKHQILVTNLQGNV